MSGGRTCIVVTSFAEGQPGFLDFSYRIKSLAAHYQLTVVSNAPLKQAELLQPDIEYVAIDGGKGRLGWLRYLLRSARLIRSRRPHGAVLLHSMVSPVALLVGRIPSVTYWNEHPTHLAPEPSGFSPLAAGLRAAVRWLMFQGARQSSLVMPIGEAHRDDLMAHGCNPGRIRMCYMGVDHSFSGVALASRHAHEREPIKLVYVGSVQKDRGRDVMLEAMALANAEKVIAHLTIVGASDEQLQYCRDVTQRLGIQAAVTIQGRVSGQLIPTYLSQADVGLCLWEDLSWYRFNPPTKLFEYLVAGLPVLASNIRTHTQYVQNGFNGRIFEYDSASLAQAIQHLWQTREQLPAMKVRARDSSDAYRWQNIEPEFLDAVSGVMR